MGEWNEQAADMEAMMAQEELQGLVTEAERYGKEFSARRLLEWWRAHVSVAGHRRLYKAANAVLRTTGT